MSFPSGCLEKLTKELALILKNDWDYSFCMRKLKAYAENDVSAFIEIMEEELAVKSQRLGDLTRAGVLTAEIVENLRARIRNDEALIAEMEEKLVAQEWKDQLITNLETEMIRLSSSS